MAHKGRGELSAPQVAERCVMLMLNEAVRCVDEQVIRRCVTGILAAAFGIGLPRFLGWTVPLYRFLGAAKRSQMVPLATQYGSRFYPLRAFSRI
ncbi:hypothetical protein ACNKHR_21950 [Shigella flexneri]